jgi:hypothetical protein
MFVARAPARLSCAACSAAITGSIRRSALDRRHKRSDPASFRTNRTGACSVRTIRTLFVVLLSGCAVEGLGQGDDANPFLDDQSVQAVAAALAPPSNAFGTNTNQFMEGIDNQGSWSPTFEGSDGNANYATGEFGVQLFRSFWTFDLTTLDLAGRSIVSAAVQVQGSSALGDATETVQLFDVHTDAAVLNANNGASQAIYDDLGTGTFYGELEVIAHQRGIPHGLLWIPLNADARADLSAAAGGFFSVGAALEDITGPFQDVVFGFTSSAGIQQVVVCFDTDVDTDGDGVCDLADDCPTVPNADQLDRNSDGVGDICADDDGDGVLNDDDNCDFAANVDQADTDSDTRGDACDNCLAVENFHQDDVDGDLVGDACDNCPYNGPADQTDSDQDGTGDVCEDSDEDGYIDSVDNCPDVVNYDQANRDGDLQGDACDASSLHDLELRKVKASKANVRRGAQGALVVTALVRNRYAVPETVQVCASVTSELPAGCYPEGLPCSSSVVMNSVGTREFKVNVPIACATDAARGSYAVSVEAEISYDSSNGYDEDLSDNTLSTSSELRVK